MRQPAATSTGDPNIGGGVRLQDGSEFSVGRQEYYLKKECWYSPSLPLNILVPGRRKEDQREAEYVLRVPEERNDRSIEKMSSNVTILS
jgi:hypothetical protein